MKKIDLYWYGPYKFDRLKNNEDITESHLYFFIGKKRSEDYRFTFTVSWYIGSSQDAVDRVIYHKIWKQFENQYPAISKNLLHYIEKYPMISNLVKIILPKFNGRLGEFREFVVQWIVRKKTKLYFAEGYCNKKLIISTQKDLILAIENALVCYFKMNRFWTKRRVDEHIINVDYTDCYGKDKPSLKIYNHKGIIHDEIINTDRLPKC